MLAMLVSRNVPQCLGGSVLEDGGRILVLSLPLSEMNRFLWFDPLSGNKFLRNFCPEFPQIQSGRQKLSLTRTKNAKKT